MSTHPVTGDAGIDLMLNLLALVCLIGLALATYYCVKYRGLRRDKVILMALAMMLGNTFVALVIPTWYWTSILRLVGTGVIVVLALLNAGGAYSAWYHRTHERLDTIEARRDEAREWLNRRRAGRNGANHE